MSTAAELTAPPSLVIEVSLLRAIPVSFAAGTLGSRLPNALPAELRQLSLAAGIEPATFGSDVTRACATPQTF
jgi:acetyl-CoA acetyltransferase